MALPQKRKVAQLLGDPVEQEFYPFLVLNFLQGPFEYEFRGQNRRPLIYQGVLNQHGWKQVCFSVVGDRLRFRLANEDFVDVVYAGDGEVQVYGPGHDAGQFTYMEPQEIGSFIEEDIVDPPFWAFRIGDP